jgi:hypothetical protein
MANSYLSRSESSAGSSTKGTLSAWLKRSKITSEYPRIFSSYIDNSNHWKVYFDNTDRLNVYGEAGGSLTNQVITTRKFKDTDAFYHIVVAVDSTQGSSSDRVKVYVNGVQETAFDVSTYPSSSANMKFNGGSGNTDVIGKKEGASSDYFDGYMSHVSWVDGAALAPTSFGEADSTTGQWKFKSPTGVTWGTNGFHLKFESSGALGTDSSGESNTFTVNGNLKQSISTPSNVLAAFSRSSWWDGTATNGNTTTNPSGATAYRYVTTGIGVDKGKWYWEMKLSTVGDYTLMGITSQPSYIQSASQHNILGSRAYDYSVVYNTAGGNGHKYNNAGTSPTNTPGAYMAGFSANDILTFALDLDSATKKLYIGVGGQWANGSGSTNQTFGNTTGITITAPASTDTGSYFPASGEYGGADGVCEFNFGEGRFGTTAVASAGTKSTGDDSIWEYDCPTGYYGLNTKNLNTYG